LFPLALTVGLLLLAPQVDAGVAAGSYDSTACRSCHAKLFRHKDVHPAAESAGCGACHVLSVAPGGKCQGSGGKAFKPVGTAKELCLGCHDVQSKTALHPAIEVKGCVACHDPHASDNDSLLRQRPPDLCYGCHDRKDDGKDVHTAVKDGKCLGCHNPHSGEAEPLLKAEPKKLCDGCHRKEKLLPSPFRHPPVAEGRCLDCHDPHASNFPKHTVAEGKKLCLKCHDSKARVGLDRPGETKRIDLSLLTVHPPLEVSECQECHVQTHSADTKKLLKKAPPDLCYGCHDHKDDERYTHGAVKMGDCTVCHSPHTTNTLTLLKQPSPAKLCFQCHQDDVTGRNFVHRPVKEGNCTACHNPHGAKNPFNLKLGFGKEVCYACHQRKDEVKVKHGALERYGCTVCHDPHGSANPFQLVKPVNTLCQSCHKDKLDGAHATTFVPGGHKVEGGVDPRRLDRSFSCVSCHNPHGSDNPKLFYSGSDAFEMCDGCHGDRTGKHPELRDIHRAKRPAAWTPPPPGQSLLHSPDGGIPALNLRTPNFTLTPEKKK
jgi:predicted CXXCH cytochrome family protein